MLRLSSPDVAAPFTRQVVVRMSDDLYRLLEDDAHANGRTKAQTVRFHLERAYGLREGGGGE